MPEQITERQHYVPRTYLKHFAERKGSGHYTIHILENVNLKSEAITERNTKSVCYEKHLYTQPGTTAEEQMLLENFYADALEDKYGQAYEILVDPEKKVLTAEERELIISTVATMFYRVPIWIKKNNDLMERVFNMCIEASKQTGQKETRIQGNDYLIEGKTKEELLTEYITNNKAKQVISQLKVAIALISVRLKNDNIYVFKLEDGNQEFITSDNPVKLQNPGTTDIRPFDPTNIIKLPLDAKHYLMLMPNENKENLNRITRHNAKGNFSKREELISNSEQRQGSDEYILGNLNSLNRFLEIKDKPIVLTDDELEFEKKLIELGMKEGWIPKA